MLHRPEKTSSQVRFINIKVMGAVGKKNGKHDRIKCRMFMH